MTTKPDLEYDLLSNKFIKNKCKNSRIYSQNLYAAMANNQFFYDDKRWSCSWRYSGSIVAVLRENNETYIDFYCSGVASDNNNGFVSEGTVTDEIKQDLLTMGWTIKPC
ncbi:MAG: hypothetical protein EBS93_08910 [Chitinophagia bacterium]|nr:hypothetical protein [Chitinophagia bacterium]NCA30822.1 hypothetical protein [Chitinophagia bacterium]